MRNTAVPIAVIALLGFVQTPIQAQSRYIDSGESGVGICAGYAAGRLSSGPYLYLGYSHLGRNDIGITVEHFSGDIDVRAFMKSPALAGYFDEDIELLRISPGIAGYLIKQMESIPLSAGMRCSYVEEYYTGGNIDNSGTDFYSRGMSFSIFIDRRHPISGNLELVPAADISYHFYKVTAGSLSGSSPFELFEYDSRISFSFSCGMAFQRGTRSRLVIIPSVTLDNEENKFYRIGLGYIRLSRTEEH